MSGFEVAGFAVGVPVILPLVEKSLHTWRSVAATKAFGSDMTGIVAQLIMEFYRFYAWIRVSGIPTGASGEQSIDGNDPTQASMAGSRFLEIKELASTLEAPLEAAIGSVVSDLEEVNKIVEKYKIREEDSCAASDPQSAPKSVVIGLGSVLPLFGTKADSRITAAVVQRRNTERAFQEKTSLKLRFTFGSKPWGMPDKKMLQDKVSSLSYWNDRLEKLLPEVMKLSISQQALPGQILRDENEELLEALMKASEHENTAIRAHAMLWKERIDFRKREEKASEAIEEHRRDTSSLTAAA
ncbi:hypothetical protein ABW19_dt0200863 [Dactylella cylindrospora]|nr:hypothetical protein ABW19_dt0200863 [Dactylella cylindrospora]